MVLRPFQNLLAVTTTAYDIFCVLEKRENILCSNLRKGRLFVKKPLVLRATIIFNEEDKAGGLAGLIMESVQPFGENDGLIQVQIYTIWQKNICYKTTIQTYPDSRGMKY